MFFPAHTRQRYMKAGIHLRIKLHRLIEEEKKKKFLPTLSYFFSKN